MRRNLLKVEATQYRMYEKKYSDIYLNQQKLADVAVMFSYNSANYIECDDHVKSIYSIMQGMYFINKSVDFVFEDDIIGRLQEFKLIILPEVAMQSDYQIMKIKKYLNKTQNYFVLVSSYDILMHHPMLGANREIFQQYLHSQNWCHHWI